MASKPSKARFFEIRFFSFVIAGIVFLITVFLNYGTIILTNLDSTVLDYYFRDKPQPKKTLKEGVEIQEGTFASKDIVIAPIDFESLQRLGRWPFPRSVEATYLNSLSRIMDQNARERAVLLDIFFVEKDSMKPENDVMLINAIKENGRVFLETLFGWDLLNNAGQRKIFYAAENALEENCGSVKNVKGDWEKVEPFFNVEPPLEPYGRATHGFGHATYTGDSDQVTRKKRLIARFSRLEQEIPVPVGALAERLRNIHIDKDNFEWLGWLNKDNGLFITIPYPFTDENLKQLEEQMSQKAARDTRPNSMDEFYIIRKFKDSFIPSISFSLALEYMHKKIEDVEVKFGEYVKIPSPEYFNTETNTWETPYRVKNSSGNGYRTLDQIVIPIDDQGNMLINYMGPGSSGDTFTFYLSPFYRFAMRSPGPDPKTSPIPWNPSKIGLNMKNRLVLVGAFWQGADEKPTPFGLMHGVEVHANALDTIIRNNFLYHTPVVIDLLILLGVIVLITFISFVGELVFQSGNYLLSFSAPPFAVILTVLAVVAYRVIFEERDKRRIRGMFGKYVSPAVVDQILQDPPELGGVDKELTVLFSDIRGFTTLSESMSPQALVDHLNSYLTAMTDLILEYRGTLDKYVGDEIMCFWGAPLPQADHAILACKCALKQMQRLRELNEQWPPEKRINIGIGLNSGIMTVGNMGSLGRMNYTLMGDNVNLGARLEGTNKEYHTNVIISEFTYGLVKDRVTVRELDNIRVKGKNKPVVIYELLDIKDGLEPT
ncbi:MAG: adenylate/guanylate cyclase domain-containing protein [Spirochaetia bacterium]